MNSLSAIALSGMNAAQMRMHASAHNVANALTPEFRRQLVAQQAQPEGGVSATLTQAHSVGPALVEDLVTQRNALYLFIANLRTIQTQDRMMGSLLDTRV